MPYVTSIERIGLNERLLQGISQGEVHIFRRLLTRHFGPLPDWAEAKPTQPERSMLDCNT